MASWVLSPEAEQEIESILRDVANYTGYWDKCCLALAGVEREI